jgi:hypothetical protein
MACDRSSGQRPTTAAANWHSNCTKTAHDIDDFATPSTDRITTEKKLKNLLTLSNKRVQYQLSGKQTARHRPGGTWGETGERDETDDHKNIGSCR